MTLPPFDNFPEIISDVIVLRQIQTSDIKDIVDISFYDGRQALTLDDASEMLDKINEDYINGSSIHWGIADKKTNAVMGTVGYYRGFSNGTGELGCVLKTAFQGKGFMTEAIKRVIEFGVERIGLAKIVAVTTTQNKRAINLLERLKFVKIADVDDNRIEYQARILN